MIKKSLLLIIIAICAIFIDGTLTHDIFDYRLDSFSKWASTILILIIILLISWPQSNKKNKTFNKKN
jgi:hypothetical protein